MNPPNESKEVYDTCCSKTSVGFVKYFSTLLISFSILIFCFVQIARNEDDDNTIYFSLISAIMTLFFPAPSLVQSSSSTPPTAPPSLP